LTHCEGLFDRLVGGGMKARQERQTRQKAPTRLRQDCSVHGVEIGRKETAKQIVLTCRCEEGFWPFNVACSPRDFVLAQIKPGLQLRVFGVFGLRYMEAAPD
jgi:hypothetical protein